jgi:hypothetical protein
MSDPKTGREIMTAEQNSKAAPKAPEIAIPSDDACIRAGIAKIIKAAAPVGKSAPNLF